eukprot:6204422-Pleurochrysis_carterae.AAC.2
MLMRSPSSNLIVSKHASSTELCRFAHSNTILSRPSGRICASLRVYPRRSNPARTCIAALCSVQCCALPLRGALLATAAGEASVARGAAGAIVGARYDRYLTSQIILLQYTYLPAYFGC